MSDDIILERMDVSCERLLTARPITACRTAWRVHFRRRSCRRTKTPIWYCFAARVQISAPAASGTTALARRRRRPIARRPEYDAIFGCYRSIKDAWYLW